jgi:RNA polymerase sigma-70 factor (ECF subfamily)
MAAKETPNLDTTNQSPEYLLEEEEFKIKLQNAIASN